VPNARRSSNRGRRGRIASAAAGGFSPDDFAAPLRLWSVSNDPNVVLDGSNIVSLPNRGTLGGLLEQTTGTAQPLHNSGVADFDGGDILISTLDASEFNFAHDGVNGMTCAFIYFHDNTSFFQRCNATMNANTEGFHFGLAVAGADGRSAVQFRVGNASSHIINLSHDYGTDPINTWHTLIATYSSALGGELWADGVSVDSGAESGTPSSGDATHAFGFGGVTVGTFRGLMPRVLLYEGVVTDDEIAQLHTYLAGVI